MSTNRIVTIPQTLFNATSMGGDLTSQVLDLRGIIGYSVEVSWASGNSLDGVIIVYASNSNLIFNPAWTTNVSGTTGSALLNVERAMYSFAKVMWDRTGGTGLLTCTASLKYK